MPTTLQFRRGTTSELSTVTGAVGEIFVDTTKNTIVVMDGTTAGGHPLAVEASDTPTEPIFTLGTDFTFAIIGDYGNGTGYIRVEDVNFGEPISVDFYNFLTTLTVGSEFSIVAVVDGTTYNTVLSLSSITTPVSTSRNDLYYNFVSGDTLPFTYSVSELTLTFAAAPAAPVTLNAPLINGGVLNSGGINDLIVQGNVLTENSTITITSGENGGGYFSYNPFYDAIMLVIQPQIGKPLVAIQTLQPGDLVSVTLEGISVQYQVELVVDTNNSFSNEHFIKFVDDTGLPESGFEAITVPLRPGVHGSQEFIVNSTLTTRRASEFISVQGDLYAQYDYLKSAIWYVNAANTGMSGDFSVSISNVPFNNNRVVEMTLIVAQGATAYIPNSVSVNGFSTTIQWLGGVTPAGTANATDVFSFSLLRVNNSNSWTVLGSVSSYKSVS